MKLELADKHHIASPDKIHLIPLGMDLSAFGALPPARRTGGRITVGWMGRFVPIKDIPLLLAVARETAASAWLTWEPRYAL